MMNGSPSAILTLGFGSWGSTSLVVTLGFGAGTEEEVSDTATVFTALLGIEGYRAPLNGIANYRAELVGIENYRAEIREAP